MSKIKKNYICNNCGTISLKWSGQCSDCGTWGSLEEEFITKPSSPKHDINLDGYATLNIELLDENIKEVDRVVTSLSEFNRVLGGGFVAGSVTLIGGDPGIGKSTILLQLTTLLSKQKLKCLYITGEESSDQVKLRAKRLELSNVEAEILAATNINSILATINKDNKYDFVVIDSIQTVYSSDFPSAPGTVTQIRACTQYLINYAKNNNVILVIVGHVTKDGELAGPKVLEHMVDTVLYFEGENSSNYRILRAVKNRFGGVNEIGVFEMTGSGLKEILNPSELFILQRENNVSGTALFAGIEGSRPILVEVQALIAPSNLPTPRRSAVGWDQNRLSMIIAVLSVRFGLNFSNREVYLSIAGGLKISDPAIDLAVAAALISSALNVPLPNNSVFFGEIGLSGEIRNVRQSEARIRESLKQGYNEIYTSNFIEELKANIKKINHIKQLKSLF